MLWQVAMLLFYFVLYITALRRGFRQLHRQSYAGYLDANIRIRLQASLQVSIHSLIHCLSVEWLGNQISSLPFYRLCYTFLHFKFIWSQLY